MLIEIQSTVDELFHVPNQQCTNRVALVLGLHSSWVMSFYHNLHSSTLDYHQLGLVCYQSVNGCDQVLAGASPGLLSFDI